MKRRLTMAQAIVAYLQNQYSARDGQEHRFFAGVSGIFGHGNVAGVGQALEQDRGLQYYLCRNEQAMVHTAAAFAKASVALLGPESAAGAIADGFAGGDAGIDVACGHRGGDLEPAARCADRSV